MSNYQISYLDAVGGTRTIDLLPGDDGVRVEWRTEINRNTGSTGIIENVVQNTMRYVTFDCYFQEAAFHKLESFLSFAQQGQPFTFAKDTNKNVSFTVNSDITAGGSTIINVNEDASLSLVPGDFLYIADLYGSKWDIAEILIPNPGSIGIVESTQNSYTVGDVALTWYYYFPSLYLMDENFDPNRDGAFWHHTFNCVEVRTWL